MFKGKTVLVVDDEPDLREILKDEFAYEGADVSEAKNGKEALELVKSRKFDAVLSDIRMPGGDGVTLAREIKALNSQSPIVFLITGFADLKSFEAYDLGAEGFFTKPFHLEELRESVSRLLQDPASRWSQVPSEATKKELKIDLPFGQALQSGAIQLGRGGLFVRSQQVSGYKLGEAVQLVLPDWQARAIVRWVRSEDAGTLPPGLGLELKYMPSASLEMVLKELQSQKPRAYIPQT
ncbi:MAG: response regulator [Proteobacteria bacterium]|nr:response regulator [Pseudomonadota bacterium]